MVCATEHCNLVFYNKCTFVGKKKGKNRHKASSSSLMNRLEIFNCMLLYSETAKGQRRRSEGAAGDAPPGDTCCQLHAQWWLFFSSRKSERIHSGSLKI